MVLGIKLNITGGRIPQWLIDAIRYQIGHLEKGEKYCSSCGNKMDSDTCSCGKKYDLDGITCSYK